MSKFNKINIKKILFFILPFAVGVFLLGGILYYIGLDAIIEAGQMLKWRGLLIITSVFVLVFLSTAIRWRMIVQEKYKVKVTPKEMITASILDFTISYLTPTVYIGGEPARAYYIGQKTGLSFKKGLTSSVIDKLLDLTGYATILIIGVLASLARLTLPNNMRNAFELVAIFLFFGIILFINRATQKKKTFSKLICFFLPKKIKFLSHLGEKIKEMEEDIIDFFHNNPAFFKKTIFLTALSRALLVFEVWLLVYLLGIKISLTAALTITAVITFSYLFPIPGALGSFEAAMTLAFPAIGLPSQTGLVFALIVRTIYLVGAIIGIFVITHTMGKKIIKEIIRF